MTSSLKAILLSSSSSTIHLSKLHPETSLDTLIKEVKKVLALKTPPKDISIFWNALLRVMDCGVRETAETASDAMRHLVQLTHENISSSDLRKVLRAKSASLPLKLLCLSLLTSHFHHFTTEFESLISNWCLEYASETTFIGFLIQLVTEKCEILSRFDFSEVVILICNHCLVSPTAQEYHKMTLRLIKQLTKSMWSMHMASMSVMKVLCLLYEEEESEEVVMWLLTRRERTVYCEMLLDLVAKREEDVQVGAGCFLVVAAWVRRLDAFPIYDLLLLQILDGEKTFTLQPLIPEIVAALASLVMSKGEELTCEWLYILSLLGYAHTCRKDSNISCQVQSILDDILHLQASGHYKGDSEALLRLSSSLSPS